MTSPGDGGGKFDLGEAHGTIKLDVDDRGAKLADKALGQFERTLRRMERTLNSFGRNLKQIERELQQVSRNFNRADRDAQKYDQSISKVEKSTYRTRAQSFLLNQSLLTLVRQMKRAAMAAEDLVPPLLAMGRAMMGLRNAERNLGGVLGALGRSGAASVGVGLLASKFLGLGKVMNDLPGWQRNIIRVVGAMQSFGLVAGILARVTRTAGLTDRAFNAISSRFDIVGKRAAGLRRALDNLPKGLGNTITGLALLRQGLKGLIDRLGFLSSMRPAILAGLVGAFTLLSAAVEAGGKVLSWFSNILLGVLDGAKQLAGGLLALPGIFATLGLAMGVLMGTFKGIGDNFKDLLNIDPSKAAEAWDKLPEHLKPLGKVIKDIVPQWQKLQEVLQTSAIQGAADQFRSLSETYLPLTQKGALGVLTAFRGMKDQVAQFATSQGTVNDVGRAFDYTRQSVQNLARGLQPALAGLRDITIVGMEFTRNLTDGFSGLTTKFAEWAAVNRANGNLLSWMQESVQGVKDLVRGLWDASKALWTILTMFATDSGDNALERFADSMERFNNAVQKSAASGFLKELADGVRGLGTEKIDQMVEVAKDLWETFKEALPIITDIAESFREVFEPALHAALEVLEQIFNVIDASGASEYIGWILGAVAAWKLFAAILGPLRNVVQGVVGAFLAMRGIKQTLSGAVGFLDLMTGSAGKLEKGVTKVGKALVGVGIAAAGIAAVWMIWDDAKQKAEDFTASVAESKQQLEDFKVSLRDAFNADMGNTGASVFDSVVDQSAKALETLQAQADQVPNWWDNIVASGTGFKKDASWNPFAQSDEFNDMQKVTQDAAQAKEAFDRLGMSSETLSGAITGTDAIFNQTADAFRNSGDGGNEAAAILQKLRDEFKQTQAEFQKAGSGNVALVNAIRQIGDEGADTASKLEGLRNALKALGLDKTSEYENAFAYAEAIRQIGVEAASLVDASQPLADVFGPNGSLNFDSVNAENLFNALSPAVEQFKQAAADGKNVNDEFNKLIGTVPQLAAAFTPVGGSVADTDAKIRSLIASLGGVPDIVSILVSVKGGDKINETLAAITTKLIATAGQQEITIPIVPGADPAKLKSAIEAALGPVVNSISEDTVTIKPGVDQAALDRLKASLSQNGIGLPGGPTPAPVELPVAPVAGTAAGKPPEVAPAPADQAALDKANQTVAELQAKLDELSNQPAKIQLDTASLQELRAKVDEIESIVTDKAIQIKVGVEGLEQAQSQFTQLSAILNTSVMSWNNYQNSVGMVIRNVLTGIDSLVREAQAKLDMLANGQYERGAAFVRDFARGIDENIGLGAEAAERLAQAVRDRMPGSPAKKGPLSGSGWSGVAGRAFSQDFASGISQGAPAATSAAEGMAGGAAGAVQGPYDLGKFIGRLKQLVDFGAGIVDIISRISDTVFSSLKMISDAMGEGKVFGQHPGFRRDPNISDRDLERKREDDLQSKLQDAVTGGAKDGTRAGLSDLPGVEGLKGVKNPGPEEIAAAILGEATKRGYDRNTAIAGISAALKESGLDETQTNATGHESLFQTSADKGVGHNAADQINWFFDKLDSLGGPSATSDDPFGLIADKVEIGGYSGASLAEFSGQAADLVDSMTSALTTSMADASSDLSGVSVTGREGLDAAAENLLQQVVAQFPEVTDIGGVRDDPKPDHPSGRALDIMIGENMALGDQINEFLRSNADALGIHSTIWRDTWRDMEGNASNVEGHMDHIHARTLETADAFNNALIDPNAVDPTRSIHGLDSGLGPDLSNFSPDELDQLNATSGLSLQTQDQMLNELRRTNTGLDQAITAGQDPKSSDDDVANSLSLIQQSIDKSTLDDTAAGRQQTQALEGVKSGIMGDRGMSEAANPIDTASTIASSAMSIAKDVFAVVNSTIDAIGAVKEIGDVWVRGIENSEDIFNLVDQVQVFIDLAARVAGSVSSIAGAAAAIAGASGGTDGGAASGALSAVSGIAGIISGVYDTVNAYIDLAQEAYRIIGSYVGDFLGSLVGGTSRLEGDVRFLLDENTQMLRAYSRDNPMDKRDHYYGKDDQLGAQVADRIGELNIFPERGTDPSELTRQMMFAVRTAGMSAADVM